VIWLACLLGAAALWLQALLPWKLPIAPWVPTFAVLLLLRSPRIAIAVASLCGLCTDLFSSDPLGIHSLAAGLAALAAVRTRRFFSLDEPLSFALFSGLLSILVGTAEIALLFLFDRRIPFYGKWWATDWLLLPVFDAAYALVWFVGPLSLYRLAKRTWMVYWLRKKNLSTD
jgi:rod shape-determining protein MreD